MRRTAPHLTLTITCTLAAGLLAACGSDPEEHEAHACEAISNFSVDVGEARTLLASSPTVGEIRDMRAELQVSYAEVADALTEVTNDRVRALEEAWAQFDAAVADVEPDATVPEAVASLQEEIADVERAEQDLRAGLEC